MAALTVTDGVFGTKGTTCPATTYKMVDISRTVDFGVKNVVAAASGGSNYALVAIPKGFLVSHIAVEQTALTAADLALTFKCDTDTTPVQLGGTFTLDDATLLRDCQDADSTNKTATFFSDARTLCVCVPNATSSDVTVSQGAFAVHVFGYQTFGESLGDVASTTPAWAEGQSAADAAANKSGGDPMFRG